MTPHGKSTCSARARAIVAQSGETWRSDCGNKKARKKYRESNQRDALRKILWKEKNRLTENAGSVQDRKCPKRLAAKLAKGRNGGSAMVIKTTAGREGAGTVRAIAASHLRVVLERRDTAVVVGKGFKWGSGKAWKVVEVSA